MRQEKLFVPDLRQGAGMFSFLQLRAEVLSIIHRDNDSPVRVHHYLLMSLELIQAAFNTFLGYIPIIEMLK